MLTTICDSENNRYLIRLLLTYLYPIIKANKTRTALGLPSIVMAQILDDYKDSSLRIEKLNVYCDENRKCSSTDCIKSIIHHNANLECLCLVIDLDAQNNIMQQLYFELSKMTSNQVTEEDLSNEDSNYNDNINESASVSLKSLKVIEIFTHGTSMLDTCTAIQNINDFLKLPLIEQRKLFIFSQFWMKGTYSSCFTQLFESLCKTVSQLLESQVPIVIDVKIEGIAVSHFNTYYALFEKYFHKFTVQEYHPPEKTKYCRQKSEPILSFEYHQNVLPISGNSNPCMRFKVENACPRLCHHLIKV